jgi:ankyrin repeat protein
MDGRSTGKGSLQVLLAMNANVEDRGIKGDCTPLMEAASAGHVDIVRLLIAHNADVNAQSSSGKSRLSARCKVFMLQACVSLGERDEVFRCGKNEVTWSRRTQHNDEHSLCNIVGLIKWKIRYMKHEVCMWRGNVCTKM